MKLLLTFLLLIFLSTLSKAASTDYYWVVESTACSQGSSVIRIYNDQHEHIYTEKIEGKTLDTTNKRVIKQLNRKARKLEKLMDKK